MQRTRDWYLALGYGNPYRWAHYADVPFQPLKRQRHPPGSVLDLGAIDVDRMTLTTICRRAVEALREPAERIHLRDMSTPRVSLDHGCLRLRGNACHGRTQITASPGNRTGVLPDSVFLPM
jgi:hypothetical protein